MILDSESDLPMAAQEIVSYLQEFPVVLLHGEMGTGKTTLTKQIGRKLGVVDEMSSPTFSIVNEYLTESGDPIYHFDFYRLEEFQEAIDIGVEDYLFSGEICLLEWPDLIAPVLPDKYLEINIKLVDGNKREITIRPHG